MHILVVGGSGHVGTLTLPHLAKHHTLRVFDLKPPADTRLEYFPGDVSDYDALAHAAQGTDLLLYMAMGSQGWDGATAITSNFDVNVKGLYLALRAAHHAGITHAVYTSSMSVYDGALDTRHFYSEDITPDARHFYGLTKRLGEEICRNACREWNLSINALRLCLPQTEEKWLAETRLGTPTIATTATDVARALLAALDYRGYSFEAFTISGDYEQKIMNMARAASLLNWQPLARPHPVNTP